MGNYFDKYDNPQPETAPAPHRPAPARVPPISNNYFDKYDNPATVAPAVPPGGVDWSRYNQPFGELKPAQLSPSQRAASEAQDLLMAGGMAPYTAGRLGRGALEAARLNPVVNFVASGADLPYHAGRGEYGAAALDALGLIPGVSYARKFVGGQRQIPMAESPRGIHDVSMQGERGRPDPYGYGPGGVTGPPPLALPDDELRAAGSAAYTRAANSPVEYHPQAIDDYIQRMVRELGQNGAHGNAHIPENSPEFYDLLGRWYQRRGVGRTNPVTAAEWDKFRGELRSLSGGPSGEAGRKAADRLEQYMASPPPGGIVSGSAAEVDALRRDLAAGRGNWRAYKTAQTIENQAILDQAAAQSAGADTGKAARGTLNTFGNTQSGVDALYGATPAERATIRAASIPSRGAAINQGVADALGTQWAHYLSGSTAAGASHLLGFDPWTSAGMAAAGGVLPSVVRRPFAAAAENASQQALADTVRTIRENSPLYRDRVAGNYMTSTGAPGAPGYVSHIPQPPIDDASSQLRDSITYALTPQIQQKGQDIWGNAFVPYANRDESAPPSATRIYIPVNRDQEQP